MRHLLALGALAPLTLSGCIVVHHGGCDEVTETLQADGSLSSLAVMTGSGDVDIEVDPDATAFTIESRTCGDDGGTLAVRELGSHLELEAECDGWRSCSMDIRVVMPPGTGLVVETGAGDVSAAGLDTGGALRTGAGNVDLECATGDYDIETGSGEVSVTCDALGELLLSTGSGDVDVEVDRLTRGIDAETGAGDVDLTVPVGSYALSVDTGSGDISLDGIGAEQDGDAYIRVMTGSGDVHVEGR